MQSDAEDRLADANLLAQSASKQSDADYLLRLLAFELLLKAVLQVHVGEAGRSHSYPKLFGSLPKMVRDRLMDLAAERMCGSADYGAVDELLDVFESNFVKLRYPYEAYEGFSESEFRRLGQEWKDAGFPTEEAVFVYHPLELEGLIYGLQLVLRTWLVTGR